MNDYFKLIIFNIIVILSTIMFKKNVKIFYLVLFTFMMLYMLILKNKLIEGNTQEDLFKVFSRINPSAPEMELPLHKISKILEKMIEKISGKKIGRQGNRCEGKFAMNKLTNKTCGDGFNERVYKIINKGDGDCLHSDLYKEKVPLRPCEFNEKCDKDLDCASALCKDRFCSYGLECSETMLSGCNYDMCLALNDDLDKALYYWHEDECKVNPCNENTYQMCDEGGCNDLSYKFRYNRERNHCEQIISDDGDTFIAGSYEDIIDRYKAQGGYDSICKGVGIGDEGDMGEKGACEVGPTGEPRYYCNDGYANEGVDGRGSSGECIPCPSGTAGTDGTCEECPSGQSTEDKTRCLTIDGDLSLIRRARGIPAETPIDTNNIVSGCTPGNCNYKQESSDITIISDNSVIRSDGTASVYTCRQLQLDGQLGGCPSFPENFTIDGYVNFTNTELEDFYNQCCQPINAPCVQTSENGCFANEDLCPDLGRPFIIEATTERSRIAPDAEDVCEAAGGDLEKIHDLTNIALNKNEFWATRLSDPAAVEEIGRCCIEDDRPPPKPPSSYCEDDPLRQLSTLGSGGDCNSALAELIPQVGNKERACSSSVAVDGAGGLDRQLRDICPETCDVCQGVSDPTSSDTEQQPERRSSDDERHDISEQDSECIDDPGSQLLNFVMWPGQPNEVPWSLACDGSLGEGHRLTNTASGNVSGGLTPEDCNSKWYEFASRDRTNYLDSNISAYALISDLCPKSCGMECHHRYGQSQGNDSSDTSQEQDKKTCDGAARQIVNDRSCLSIQNWATNIITNDSESESSIPEPETCDPTCLQAFVYMWDNCEITTEYGKGRDVLGQAISKCREDTSGISIPTSVSAPSHSQPAPQACPVDGPCNNPSFRGEDMHTTNYPGTFTTSVSGGDGTITRTMHGCRLHGINNPSADEDSCMQLCSTLEETSPDNNKNFCNSCCIEGP